MEEQDRGEIQDSLDKKKGQRRSFLGRRFNRCPDHGIGCSFSSGRVCRNLYYRQKSDQCKQPSGTENGAIGITDGENDSKPDLKKRIFKKCR